MAISTSPIPTTPAELDAIKRRLQDPTIDIAKLQQYATGLEPSIPGYIALGEISRRSRLVQNQQAQGANDNTPTVLQQTAQMAQKPPAPPQGIAQGMSPGAPPPQGGQMPPQAPPQMPQMPPKPVAAANGGLMQLPMRPDMFRRSDYAHGGVVHFDGTDESQVPEPKPRSAFREDLDSFGNRLHNFKRDNPTIASILEGLALGPAGVAGSAAAAAAKPIYKYFTQPPSKLSKEEQQGIDTGSGQKITTQTTEDPNANIKILPSGPSGGGGGAPAVDKDVRRTLDNIYKYTEQKPPSVPTMEELEAEKEKRGLNALPKTSTSRLEEVQKSYNRPRTWDENLSLMKQDALRARSGAGFSDTDIGGAARSLDASNREKSIAISLKLEEIENLDRKAEFAFKNGNFEAYKKYIDEREKIARDVQKDQATISSHSLSGIAQNQKAANVGAGGLGNLRGATTLSESTITKAKTNINEFVNSPRLDSEFWDFVPNADVIKEKLRIGKKPGNANYDSAIQDLQKFKSDIYNGYVSDLRGERAVATKKQVK